MINDIILEFFNELESVSDEYQELFDTDVRESIHQVLNYYFVWDHDIDTLPISYGMFSWEGDKTLMEIVRKFLLSVKMDNDFNQVLKGKDRLQLLQDGRLITHHGYNYDDFIGHSEEPLPPEPLPSIFFEKDDYEYDL